MKRKISRLVLVAMLGLLLCYNAYADVNKTADSITAPIREEDLLRGDQYEGILPIGSIVLLQNSDTKLMIMGYIQALEEGKDAKIYDYCGCLFPSGYESADQVYLFDHEQIEYIYYTGYQDEEQLSFIQRVEEFLSSL